MIHRLLRKIYHRSRIIQYLWLKLFWLRKRLDMRINDYQYAQKYYKKKTGNALNISNPKTFDEKLWYLKLNNRDSLLTKCSDKYLVREYVKECGLEHILNELYGVYENANDIDFDNLISPCIFKCNHVSGTNSIYDATKSFNRKFFIKTFNYMLKQNYYNISREWNYKDIKPKIVCEKLLIDDNEPGLIDYKFICFNGVVKYLFVDIDICNEDGTHNKNGKRNVYDANFNILDVKVTRERYDPNLVKKPTNYEVMKEYAAILSKPFPFCRVDLYNINGKIYFGEITFYHTGGCTKIEPKEFSYTLGDCIDLSTIENNYFKG